MNSPLCTLPVFHVDCGFSLPPPKLIPPLPPKFTSSPPFSTFPSSLPLSQIACNYGLWERLWLNCPIFLHNQVVVLEKETSLYKFLSDNLFQSRDLTIFIFSWLCCIMHPSQLLRKYQCIWTRVIFYHCMGISYPRRVRTPGRGCNRNLIT